MKNQAANHNKMCTSSTTIRGVAIGCFFIVHFLMVSQVRAQWSNDPSVNNVISNDSLRQIFPEIISDGMNGAIIAWVDYRFGEYDIYVQRINNMGQIIWTNGGVSVGAFIDTIPGDPLPPQITSDGENGVIVSWHDKRNLNDYDIFAQRINSNGIIEWTQGGIVVCNVENNQVGTKIVSDGHGGAFVSWIDGRSGVNWDVYAQRINNQGQLQWSQSGLPIVVSSFEKSNSFQLYHTTSDQYTLFWTETVAVGQVKLMAQRVDQLGDLLWSQQGIIVSEINGTINGIVGTSDSFDGSIISWSENGGGDYNVFAQQINSIGNLTWGAIGVTICDTIGDQRYPNISSLGQDGAVVSWSDSRVPGFNSSIYTQRISNSGTSLWLQNGVSVTSSTAHQIGQNSISNLNGETVYVWMEREGQEYNVRGQKMDINGNYLWGNQGISICNSIGTQANTKVICPNNESSIVAWQDERSGNLSTDIFAQQVCSNGQLGNCPLDIEEGFNLELELFPNPTSFGLKYAFNDPSCQPESIELHDSHGRLIARLVSTNGNYISMDVMPKGVYYISFKLSNKSIVRKKVILVQ